jgi:hypothetical protein
MINHQFEYGSFRDRTSRIFYINNSVYRGLNEQALNEWEILSSTKFFRHFNSDDKIVQTEQVAPPEKLDSSIKGKWVAFLKHQIIPCISYPYEWSFGMLKDAALLQIELLLAALDEDMILKDSSAFNFQWLGAYPVFIDVPSFERYSDGMPWVGYRQFCQMFLYPLFFQAYKKVPFHPWLRGSIDGIEPGDCSHLMNMRDLLRPGVFMHAYLQAKMQARYGSTQKNIRKELNQAGFQKNLIKNNVKQLRKIVKKLSWHHMDSEWSDYVNKHSYTNADQERKLAFVQEIVNRHRWNMVWDIGCNVGAFSRIAAKNADYVVAMDADHLAIEHFYRSLKAEGNRTILPLVINIADPSPDLGWQGLERKSLTKRSKPDLILCLALIHHMVISANIPLEEFVGWLGQLCSSLVIEFVTKEDPMVKTLLRNKKDNYTDYDKNFFEKCLSDKFNFIKRKDLESGTRTLYFAEAKTGP